jgi:hypothetical protein
VIDRLLKNQSPLESKVSLEVENNRSATRNSNPRGASEGYAASRLADRRFVEHREAVAEGQEERVRTVEGQIDNLLREKEEIKKWAAVGLSLAARIDRGTHATSKILRFGSLSLASRGRWKRTPFAGDGRRNSS